MAPPTNNEEPKFRFIVKIMPPRRPANSLLKRSRQAKVEEPLHIIAVPARASETFADVWKHIKERYERNYTAEEVAQGWFHKLQDRHGADIDSHDGVGELGYTINTPSEDLVLVMLQNGIDRDGSVPDTSGLRPPGFSRPELSPEQQQEAKRRKIQEERYGFALEHTDEDTPIQSRERSLAPGSPELGAQDDRDDDDAHKIDADGFAVPMLPGSVNRKRKRPHTTRGDIVPSSMEGENDEDILIQDSQTARNNEKSIAEALPTGNNPSRARTLRSVPADVRAGAPTSSVRAARAQTTGPGAYAEDDQGSLKSQRLAALQATSSKHATQTNTARPPPRSPPTPVSATSQPFTQQPPESAQRPKPTPPVTSASVTQDGQVQPTADREAAVDRLEFDPIEDDDLLQGITGTANDDHDSTDLASILPAQAPVSSTPASTKSKRKSRKLPKQRNTLSFTPKSSGSVSKHAAFTPANSALERFSGTQGSSGKNARSQSGSLELWTPEEDSLLLQGIRCGLKAAEIAKKYSFEGRTPSAVRYRRLLLIKQNPGIENATRESTSEGGTPGGSATKRRRWSIAEKQIISRAIADGYDALEIHAKYFPGRSEDSVIRVVLSLQDQAWKVASMDSMFPKNSANLPGWTPKDSCKLKRTFIEGLTTDVAKKTYFGRWTMQEVQKQLDAYSAHFKTMKEDQARASQAGSAIKKATFGSSQIPADSSQLLGNSSPVERSMHARAARRPVNVQQQNQAAHVPSSPPQPSTTKSTSLQVQTEQQPLNQEQRSSSPIVDITITEQDTARDEVSIIEQDASRKSFRRPSSGGGRQSTLNFSRDKGKQRSGDPRPTSEELDAQFVRRPTSSRTMRSATQQQNSQNSTLAQPRTSIEDEDEVSDDQHTPANDLEMLDVELDHGESVSGKPKGSIDNAENVTETNPVIEYGWHEEDSMVRRVASQAPDAPGGRRQSASTAMTMESPMTASSVSSAQRRRSRVESGVDTRVAKQLSQELNRSLSREAREAREEAAHEDQVFSTPDPKINRYHRTPRRSNVTFPEDTGMQVDNNAIEEVQTFRSQAFQTQDPTTTRSQRRSRVSFQTDQSPRSAEPGPNSARKAPSLQPSPQIGSSNSGGTHATTQATTPAKPGKLPNRGSSYASRIKDIHRPAQVSTNASAKAANPSPDKSPPKDTTDLVRDNMSPPPTDAEIWERSAVAESIGRNREEYFEDLKLSTFSIRAMGSGDWEEVRRLKAEERRLHRQRKIARGDYVPSKRDTQHPDGPAQGGDAEQADEDVIRVDDVSDASSEVEEDYDEKIWSDADFEQPADVDHDRHFSEVEDDAVDGQVNTEATKTIEEPQHSDRNRHVSEVNEDQSMLDPDEYVRGAPQANAVEVAGEHEEFAEELDLPTIDTLPETDRTARTGPTDNNLQELDNSGAEGSPTRVARRKRKIHDEENSPKARSDKHQPDDRAAMPPPPSISAKAAKRAKRRKRHSSGQHASKSGSERSSSFSHPHPSSDAPQQHVPSTPDRSEPAAHRAKRARVGETMPVEQTPDSSRAQKSQTANASQKAPSSSVKRSQRSSIDGMSGLSGLVRKAHIPTPPKAKQAPLKKKKKLDIRADDDESEESSDSD
ncbi:hypothetical protein MBLNU13_g06016t1 [Cladosporium sp. NU13]